MDDVTVAVHSLETTIDALLNAAERVQRICRNDELPAYRRLIEIEQVIDAVCVRVLEGQDL